jgi:FkbM family methyltransferase
MELRPIADLSLLVVGIVKDCAHQLSADLERLSNALSKFRSRSWLLIESDSTDRTLQALEQARGTADNFRFISLGHLGAQYPARTDRMALCRNAYVDEIRISSLYRNIDYVVVADFDGLNTHVSETSIASCFASRDWDVCAANQDAPYYDIWALRHRDWCPVDCWAQYNFLRRFIVDEKVAKYVAVYSKMAVIPQGSPWIEVDSAFGGLAIYKKKLFSCSSYDGVDDRGEQVCEHVAFHQSLRQQGYRIFINPQLINAGYTDHTECLRNGEAWQPNVYTASQIAELVSALLKQFPQYEGTISDAISKAKLSTANGDPNATDASPPTVTTERSLEYQYDGFSILLPMEHRLPTFQRQHPKYDRFLSHLVRHITQRSTIIDVGANCGDTLAAMVSVAANHKYVCIEPDDLFFSYLLANIERMRRVHVDLDVEAVQAMVGKNIRNASLEGKGGSKHAVVGTGSLNAVPLDELIVSSEAGPPIRLLKSDVDGFDYDVIDSASELLVRDAPVLFFECQIDSALQKVGYENSIKKLESYGYANWIVFDNFGEVMLGTSHTDALLHLMEYVWKQNRNLTTRTIYYFDVLAATDREKRLIDLVLSGY